MMNWRSIKYSISSLILFTLILYGCNQSDYTKMVKSELAKGVRMDSLLFNIYLGDTRQEFYARCLDLNRKQIVMEGPGNSSVQYLINDTLFHEKPTQIRMLFMPSYDQNDVITEMNLDFNYVSWAPWNKEFQSDVLKEKVQKILMHWYKGNEFVIANVNKEQFPVKVDGNRRILVEVTDPSTVRVKIQDILHPSFKHSGVASK
jgi:hypothetical protein